MARVVTDIVSVTGTDNSNSIATRPRVLRTEACITLSRVPQSPVPVCMVLLVVIVVLLVMVVVVEVMYCQ